MVLVLCVLGWTAGARADAILLMEDPIHFVGKITWAGHAALWVDTLCSDDHVTMRTCHAGETGAVISRLVGAQGRIDWMAVAPGPYFFAVNEAEDIPATISAAGVARMQADWSSGNDAGVSPNPGFKAWVQMTGESYRRRILMVRVHTTAEQEARLMRWLNERKNVSHFNIFYWNCADFVAQMLDVLFPGAVHRSYLFDAGMMTPRQIESGLHHYANQHPELGWQMTVLPQMPGDVRRSGHLFGVTEAYLKRYYYLLPLDYLLPVELGIVTGLGLADHRYAGKTDTPQDPAEFFSRNVAAAP